MADKPYTFRFPEELLEKVRAIGEKRYKTLSGCVIEALVEYVDRCEGNEIRREIAEMDGRPARIQAELDDLEKKLAKLNSQIETKAKRIAKNKTK